MRRSLNDCAAFYYFSICKFQNLLAVILCFEIFIGKIRGNAYNITIIILNRKNLIKNG